MNAPLLSVCIITYNHEKFITDAINGVLLQKVDFKYEIIIADDCSTDKTREIILQYKEKHPDLIKLIFQEKNVGAAQNWLDLITAPNSKYIAYFEGDDYWTNPLKLQKQVDFLEGNEEFVATYTNVDRIKNDIIQKSVLGIESKINFDKNTIFCDAWIPTLTFLFKTDALLKPMPKEFLEIYTGDAFLFYLIAQQGKIKYIDIITGVYRFHDGGAWSGLDQFSKIKIGNESFYGLRKFFKTNKKAQFYFNTEIAKGNKKEIFLYFKSKNIKMFLKKYISFVTRNPIDGIKYGFFLLKLLI